MAARAKAAWGGRRPRKEAPASLEYTLLYTATLCMLAGGAVMVYSASSAESLLGGSGDPSYYLKRYVVFGVVGLALLHFLSRRGLSTVRALTPVLLFAGFGLTLAVMLPGVGVELNGARRWLGAGPVQFQPAELLKLALVLYAVQLLAARPSVTGSLRRLANPLLLIVGAACVLLLAQPDMGTAIIVCLSIGSLLVVAGVPIRKLAIVVGGLVFVALLVALAAPYRRARLTAFLDPWADPSGGGYQTVQAMIGIGSGGPFGVGLGESVQKIFYLPEAHTDMIVAIIGEETGVLGMAVLVALFGMLAYGGLRTAKLAGDRYSKLLAAGLTSLILCQAIVNLFAALGLAPLTGVPLPFISYGNSNMIIVLGAMGLLLNVAAQGGVRAGERPVSSGLRAIEGGARSDAANRDRRRRDSGARRAGAGRRGRATG